MYEITAFQLHCFPNVNASKRNVSLSKRIEINSFTATCFYYICTPNLARNSVTFWSGWAAISHFVERVVFCFALVLFAPCRPLVQAYLCLLWRLAQRSEYRTNALKNFLYIQKVARNQVFVVTFSHWIFFSFLVWPQWCKSTTSHEFQRDLYMLCH